MTYTNNETGWLFLLGVFIGAIAITVLRIEFNRWRKKFAKSQKSEVKEK